MKNFTKPLFFLFLLLISTQAFSQSITGAIRCANGLAFPDVKVTLIGDGVNEVTYTDDFGQYSFENLENGATYIVTPEYDEGSLYGITTLDALLASQSFLNTVPFGPFQLLALDMDLSNTITPEDIATIRDMVVMTIPYCQNNTCWRFASTDFQMMPPAGSLNAITLQVYEEMFGIDFIGVKMGDFNFSACP